MRDYIGISPGSVPTDLTKLEPYLPELRRDLGVIDFYLRDLSRGMGRIQKGEVPDASGDPIGDVNGLFWLLAGRPGNQLAYGGTFSGGSATISSTSNPTKGFVYFGDARTSGFDESNQRVGLNVAAPVARLDMLVGAPTNQFARPSADYANNSAIVWTNEVGATTNLYQSVDESAAGDSDYVTHSRQLGTLQLRLSSVTDPGVNTGHVLRIRARVNGVLNGNDHMLITLDQVGIGGSNIVTSNNLPDDAGWSPSPIQMDTILTTYEWALSTAEAALITDYSQLVVGMGYYTGYDAGSTIEVSWVELEVPAVGGVAVAETLQKWSTGTYTDLLSFLGDGAGSTLDLTLSGDSPLRVSSGGGTSGLRFLTSSTNGRIEAGTSAQANMNLVLSGTRATAGTLLTSDFTAHLMNGALDVFLSTDRTGLRVRQFTTATVDLAQFSANNGTSHWYRIGSDGQSYFASSTTAGVVNIGAGAGSTVFKVGTTGTTGVLTLKPNQSSIFEIDIAGLSTTRFTTATKWSFLNSTALRGTTSGELTFAGPATITDHTLTWPSALPAATSALHVGTGGAMSYVNLATTYQALDADLTAIALLTGDGGLYRTAADTWALRDLAVGSDRLTITNQDGVSGNPSYDASMSSANWDFTRGVSIAPSQNESALVINPFGGAADPLMIYPVGGVGDLTDRLLRLSSTGVFGLGNTGAGSNGTVLLDMRGNTTRTGGQNFMQLLMDDGLTYFSIGGKGAFVIGQAGAATGDVTHFQLNIASNQSAVAPFLVRDGANGYTPWSLNASGQMVIRGGTDGFATTFGRSTGGSAYTLLWPNAVAATAGSIVASTTGGVLSWLSTLPIANGGTGQVTATAAFNALDPLTTLGDTLVHNGTDSARVAIGTNGQVYTVVAGTAAWAAASGGVAAHELLDGGTAHLNTVAQGVSAGSLIYGNATPKWDELVSPGVANRALRSAPTTFLPTWDRGDIDFGGFEAIAMACDNGSAFPTSPAPTEGQWFLYEPGNRRVLYQRVNGVWEPIIGLGTIVISVTSGGNDTTGNGEAATPYLTIQKAVDQLPPIVSGYVVIYVGPGSFAGAIVAGKHMNSTYNITIYGIDTPVNSRNITTAGAVLGDPTTQPVIKLTTAGPAEAIPGGIVVFTNGANINEVRVINSVSTTTNANDTLTFCGDQLGTIAAANADTLSFRPFTTVLTSYMWTYNSQVSVTIQHFKMNAADHGMVVNGLNSKIQQCHIIGASSGIVVHGQLEITDCALISTSSAALISCQNASSFTQMSGSLLRYGSGTRGPGLRLLYNSNAFIFGGNVFDGLTFGITGFPGNIVFVTGTSYNFVKNCTLVGVNGENQLLTSGLLGAVTFSGNVSNFIAYLYEAGVASRRTPVLNANYTALVSDQLISYETLSGSTKTVTLPSVAQAGSGKILVIKDESGNASPTIKITIDGSGSETIDGSPTKDITTPYGSYQIYSNPAGWFTMAEL